MSDNGGVDRARAEWWGDFRARVSAMRRLLVLAEEDRVQTPEGSEAGCLTIYADTFAHDSPRQQRDRASRFVVESTKADK